MKRYWNPGIIQQQINKQITNMKLVNELKQTKQHI